MTDGNDYPECTRLAATKEDSQKLGEFLDWLSSEKRMVLAKWHEVAWRDDEGEDVVEALFNIFTPVEKLLAEYFEIDLDQVERERQRMLDDIHNDSA